ncbi:MAG TPA: cyclic nucleotide-binding domain-containing protein [Actinomycetota bacterium]|nr:cyclic nucleotide-binding domain-containing protein [Actinomycetota bacterium]
MNEMPIEPSKVQRTGVFAELEDEDVVALLRAGSAVTFEADQAIFQTGDPGDAMFVILDGEAQVDVGGRFHRLRSGDFFGEMAVIAPGRRMATVRSATPVRALQIPADAFHAFLLEHPKVALSMMVFLVTRLREVEQRLDAWMA